MHRKPSHNDTILRLLNTHGLVPVQPHTSEEAATDESLVVFRLGNATYGVPHHIVHAISPCPTWTPLPFTPACIVGVATIEERRLTVLDVRPLFHHAQTPVVQPQALLLRIHLAHVEVCLLAEHVSPSIHLPTTARAVGDG